jgi:hypothetical protein
MRTIRKLGAAAWSLRHVRLAGGFPNRLGRIEEGFDLLWKSLAKVNLIQNDWLDAAGMRFPPKLS